MKTLNRFILEKLKLGKNTEIYTVYQKIIDMISDVIPISKEEDEKEYKAVESWVMKYKIRNIKIIMSNSAFSTLCPDCEDEFKWIKDLDYVDINNSSAQIIESNIIKKDKKPKWLYKSIYRDNGWTTYDDVLNHILIYNMDWGEYIFVMASESYKNIE